MEQTDENLKEVLVGLFTEVAIIEHLARTRIERKFPDGLRSANFGILNYFVRNHVGPDTIGGIAWSFQEDENYTANKVVALEAEGLLSVDPPGSKAVDARVEITDSGRAAQAQRLEEIGPDFEGLVAEIPFDNLATTLRTLHEIRLTLDNLPDR